ncbi:MAG: Gfo/Idh/MocA family oxidoreductase [Erysipelotrichaceae bacterium]|nr:Gfo/Idh/MocA family oxidoreductase [Erysipelotrichaceae bacterium]
MINYAIIGSGWITESMIQGIHEVCPQKLNLLAVYSRTADNACGFIDPLKEHGAASKTQKIRVYTDLDELASDPEIQAVYIASPNRFHYEQSRKMLLAGKHVLCEKPITLKEADLKELTDLAGEKHLVYLEAIMMLHQPQLKNLKDALSSLGKIYTAHIDFSQLSSKYPAYLAGKNPNIFNPAFGTGAFEDLGIYGIYFILELFGMPQEVRMHSCFLESGSDRSGEALLIYPDQTVTFSFSKVGQSRSCSQIIGDEATLTIESISQLTGITLYERNGQAKEIFGEQTKPILMGREADTFADLIDGILPASKMEELQEKALMVCGLMEKMRKIAGIRFPFEEEK